MSDATLIPTALPRSQYRQYIASPKWQRRRTLFLDKHPRCQGCGTDRDLHVHHRSYARLGYEIDDDLRTLCQGCHSLVHEVERRGGTTLAAATDLVIRGRKGQRKKKKRSVKPEPFSAGQGSSQIDLCFHSEKEVHRLRLNGRPTGPRGRTPKQLQRDVAMVARNQSREEQRGSKAPRMSLEEMEASFKAAVIKVNARTNRPKPQR